MFWPRLVLKTTAAVVDLANLYLEADTRRFFIKIFFIRIPRVNHAQLCCISGSNRKLHSWSDIIGIIEVIVLYFMSLQYVILYGRTSSHKILWKLLLSSLQIILNPFMTEAVILNPFMTEAGFYMITASVKKGLIILRLISAKAK